ncbi:MAG: GIY-YIG nuclease family protein [Candidatus Levybacteria bacterium]|nr:GIY-YIG nuclease family protein [Candidatus Levybacteria bacterium]
MFYIYILQSSKDGRTYVGYTNNINSRLKLHNSGRVKATKYRAPLKLLFSEEFQAEWEAKKRESWWKSGAGRRKLKEYFIKK